MILILSLLFSMFCTTLWAQEPCNIPPYVTVSTEDGANICVQHLPATGHPIILAHGISSNHYFWNLTPEHSLALYLQSKGFDVYNIDFRGHGYATHDPQGKKQIQGWNVDSYGTDIAAVIAYAHTQKPQQKPFYIGHSLGGLAFISYLAHYGSSHVQGVVIVASPFDFGHKEPLLEMAEQGAKVSFLPIPTPLLAHVASLFPSTPAYIDTLLWGKDTISPNIRRLMYQKIVSPMTPKELSHLAKSLSQDAFSPAQGDNTYATNLSTHNIPALFLAGRADRVAPVDRVLGYYHALGSTDKQLQILGTHYGFSLDYGHLDYPLAKEAPKEVFPLIEQWIQTRIPTPN